MIKIAGAGLSGLTCALNLAKFGEEVLVHEKCKELGDKHGYNILAFKNYDLKDDVIKELKESGVEGLYLYPIYKIKKFSPSFDSYDLYSKRPLFYTVVRGKVKESIEQNLYKSCIGEGVEIVFGKALSEEDATVVATGGKRPSVVGCGATFKDINMEKNTIYLFYDNQYAPGGYIYIAPYINSATICLVCFDNKYFSKVRIFFERLLVENKIILDIIHEATRVHSFLGFADYSIPKVYKNGRYYVGEAAGFLEPSKGFGMRYAFISGFLAARAIAKNEDYDMLWRNYFGKELNEGTKLRKRLQQMTNKDYENLIQRFKRTSNIKDYAEDKRLLVSESKNQKTAMIVQRMVS